MMAEVPNIGRERLIAPYASPGNVTRTLARYRERNLPPQFTPEMLEDLGIGHQEAYRVLATLTHLGFLDADNHPQPVFHGVRQLSDDEYRQMLETRIRETYRALFTTLDPASDPPERIRDHFRRYDPASQTPKQFALFMALCSEAGMVERRPLGTARQRAPGNSPARPRTPQNRQGPAREIPSPVAPSPDTVRLHLMEALIQKISEVDAGDTTAVEWYLDKIKEIGTPAGISKEAEEAD